MSMVDQYSSIFARLFPGEDLEMIASLPRDELLSLALSPASSGTSPTDTVQSATQMSPGSDDVDELEVLEQAPEHDSQIREAQRHHDEVQSISDDINGLSLSVDRQSSYVGVSSISAAFKVIFSAAPVARPFIAQSYTETALPSRSNTPPFKTVDLGSNYLPPVDVGRMLIESYLNNSHIMMPMVDEDHLWRTYLHDRRTDSSWLALLNVVFALGSLASSTADNEEHLMYYQRARKHLRMETLNSCNLLVLQALILLGGNYLHWLNRPNEASCLVGAAFRMATALGLHREYTTSPPSSSATDGMSSVEASAEIRRRTWWSLCCLDSSANMTTGRPSLGRMSPAVTVLSPCVPVQMNTAQYLDSMRLLPFIHSISFCKIATRIQDRLAVNPLLGFEELLTLDAELVQWHEELPPVLKDVGFQHQDDLATPTKATVSGRLGQQRSMSKSFDFSQPPERDNIACPEVIKTPRAIMHWWYLTLRMLMYRPYLLAVALRKTGPANTRAEETTETLAVTKCRIIASEAIGSIRATCRPELLAGWNAVWLMYQATMVPLVSLFLYLSSSAPYRPSRSHGAHAIAGLAASDEDAETWRAQIETAINFFDSMQQYSLAAKKTRDVVQRLYDASKHVSQYNEAIHMQQVAQNTQRQQQSSSYAHSGIPAPVHMDSRPNFNTSAAYEVPNTSTLTSPNTYDYYEPSGPATQSFWNDMMWDTLPAMPDIVNTAMGGTEHINWAIPNGLQNSSDTPAQNWQAWQDWGPQFHG
ncbi:hypothetical protein LTR62_001062 [Meristemomyces frigidus]|uniref:Xylanolytic transcriptional activator regulatory domain-containing protein n=1 Tax=Meristemomyces frigidus TaxID=1508187 RepID=A0AAN7YGI0_9PEZI|nr:hypothetical protein LTR62_001062 [Meristemomyces frigidus]